MCLYRELVLHTTARRWAQGGASPPFQVVTMKGTYRQNFSDLPKRLEELLNSLEGVGKLHLRVLWLGGHQAGGALHGAPALSLSHGAGAVLLQCSHTSCAFSGWELQILL